jgi:hypothetical protein
MKIEGGEAEAKERRREEKAAKEEKENGGICRAAQQ